MGFSRQEYWSGLPFPSLEDLPDPGVEPRSPALQADSLLFELQRKPFSGLASEITYCHFCFISLVTQISTDSSQRRPHRERLAGSGHLGGWLLWVSMEKFIPCKGLWEKCIEKQQLQITLGSAY